MTAVVHLRPGHVQPVWLGHPWVYAQAIARVEGAPGAGDEVSVFDPQGKPLGRGYWSPSSAIPVRILHRDADASLDAGFLRARIADAASWRRSLCGLPGEATTGFRLVHAEGDGLPGLVVDAYGDDLAAQFVTVGMHRRRAEIARALREVTGAKRVFSVAAAQMERLEGFTPVEGLLDGDGEGPMRCRENGLALTVPTPGAEGQGQKTGYYFDQRDNRRRVGELSQGRRVLDLFTYMGGFALTAARSGAAEVVAIDSSRGALERARVSADENGLADRVRWVQGDVPKSLVAMEASERFDVVVCDPPKLAHHSREVRDALAHYRRVNRLAMQRVAPGGVLVSCSCSGSVSRDDLLRTMALAAREVDRALTVLDVTSAGMDHPVPAAFSEGRYLKCVWARVT